MGERVSTIGEQVRSESEATGTRQIPSAARQLWTVARSEYRLAIRNRWALALVGLFAVFGSMLVTFSGSAVGPEGVDRVVASLTNLSVYLVPLAALAFGYDAIVGRDQEGWLSVVFSLPVSRSRVTVGTYLGRASVLAGAGVVGFGFVGLMMFREFGTARWPVFAVFLGATVGVALVFLALGVLVSALAKEKTHALGLALLLWVWFVLVHELLALGTVAAFELPDVALSALVVANPASVFRVLVLEHLGTTAGGFGAALATTGLSTGVLAGALVVWCVGAVAAAAAVVDSNTSVVGRLVRLGRRIGPASLVLVVALGAGTGCFGDGDEATAVQTQPVVVESGQSCEVCGMIVGEGQGAYGPNAQVFFDGEDHPAHYDSVREMYLDISARQRRGDEPVGTWVTDYGAFDYELETRRGDRYITGSTAPETFVEASKAVYVADSGLQGAMGAELIPFGDRAAAEAFVGEHGGEIVDYDEIDAGFVEGL